jgi:hypothetical protein
VKNVVALFALVGALPSIAGAAGISRVCYSKAETAVKKQAQPGYYDRDGIEALSCELAANQKAVLCEVGALKGEGAAADTYRVVLNASCSRVFRVDLIGEE